MKGGLIIFPSSLLVSRIVFHFSGCHSKLLHPRWLKKLKLMLTLFWLLEILGRGVGRFDFLWIFLFGSYMAIYLLPLRVSFPICLCVLSLCVLVSSKDAEVTGLEP